MKLKPCCNQCRGIDYYAYLDLVLQCVEMSIRQLKSNGSIPAAAVRAYEVACDERLAIGGL